MRRDHRQTCRIVAALRARGWRVRVGHHVVACDDHGHTLTFTGLPLRDKNFAVTLQRTLRRLGVEMEIAR